MADDTILAHWYTRFDEFSFSTHEFYERLAAEVTRREMPDVSTSVIPLPEGGLFSSKRDYYRIARGRLVFVVCGARFGIDFFVSWWLLERPGCIAGLLPWLTRRTTFYEEDTATIFRDCVHQAVLNTIDGIFASEEKKPSFDRTPVSRTRIL